MNRFSLLINLILLTFSSYSQPQGKYFDDAINENNYITFYSDSTFKFRMMYHTMSEIACGKYYMIKDTIFFTYLSDMRNSSCNTEGVSVNDHYDSSMVVFRPNKLFYKDQKLYKFENGKIKNKVQFPSKHKPAKCWGYHRKYFLFGPYVKKDVHYMVHESKVKWKKC
jgi:hypothetical protein